MIIPTYDFKLAEFRCNVNRPVYYISNHRVRNNINNIGHIIPTKTVVLKTCVDKDYIIGLYNRDLLEYYKSKDKIQGFVNSALVLDLMSYCKKNDNNLLVFDDVERSWTKMDPYSSNVSKFVIDFKPLVHSNKVYLS